MNFFPFRETDGLWRYLGVVLLPTALVLGYQALVASDAYVSRAQVMVEHEQRLPGPELAIGNLLGNTPSKVDALIVKAFMESRAMLTHLEEQYQLREHFSSPEIDPWNRMKADASSEDFLEHFLDHLSVHVDEASFITEVEFVAYEPAFSRKVSSELVARAERFVNEVSQYLANEQMKFVQGELDRAHDRMKEASRDVLALQRKYEILNPQRETESAGMIVAGLEQKLAEEQTVLKALESYLNDDAPQVRSTRKQIEALRNQIREERDRLVGSGQEGLNDVMVAYQDAEVELSVATEIYKTAIQTLETTRLDSARQVKYLVSLSEPSSPDEAEHPEILYWTLTVFVLLNVAFFVLGLIVAVIRDHRE